MSRKVKVVITQEYEITLDVAENDDNLKIIDMLNFAYAELGKDLFAFEDSVYQNTKVIEIDNKSVYIEDGIIGNSGSDIILDGKCSELNVIFELKGVFNSKVIELCDAERIINNLKKINNLILFGEDLMSINNPYELTQDVKFNYPEFSANVLINKSSDILQSPEIDELAKRAELGIYLEDCRGFSTAISFPHKLFINKDELNESIYEETKIKPWSITIQQLKMQKH